MSVGVPAFKMFADDAKNLAVDLTLQKLVYIACQLGVLLFIVHRYHRFPQCLPWPSALTKIGALRRFGSMGLLPTSASDWLGLIPVKTPVQFVAGGMT